MSRIKNWLSNDYAIQIPWLNNNNNNKVHVLHAYIIVIIII